jgi:hypothetical protein
MPTDLGIDNRSVIVTFKLPVQTQVRWTLRAESPLTNSQRAGATRQFNLPGDKIINIKVRTTSRMQFLRIKML